MAVFERIPVDFIERILGAAAGESSLALVAFANQSVGQGLTTATVPDAAIISSAQWLFEVKTERGAVNESQLRGHLKAFKDSDSSSGKAGLSDEKLFVLTPDAAEPEQLKKIDDKRILWLNFQALSAAIDGVMDDEGDLMGERTAFLLRELQRLFEAEGLLDFNDTVIVAARWAYGQYLDRAVYMCQPGRSFQRGLRYLGFYADGEIKPEVAQILHRRDQVVFSRVVAAALAESTLEFDAAISKHITQSLDNEDRAEDQPHQIFLLSGRNSEQTLLLGAPVKNDAISLPSGRKVAWTQGQRYTSVKLLTSGPARTSELQIHQQG